MTAFWNWSIASSGLIGFQFQLAKCDEGGDVVRIVALKNAAKVFFGRFVILQSDLCTAATDEGRYLRFQRLGAALLTRLLSGFAGVVERGHRGGEVAGLERGFAFVQKRFRVDGVGGAAAVASAAGAAAAGAASLAGAAADFVAAS